MKTTEVIVATPQYADADDVANFASDLTEEFLQCRELGHEWRPWTARWVSEMDAYERAHRCPRCGGERWQTLSASGHVLSESRVYPEGYLTKGMGRIVGDGRDALRLESLRRTLVATEAAERAAEGSNELASKRASKRASKKGKRAV